MKLYILFKNSVIVVKRLMILWKYFCRGNILIAPMCCSLNVDRALKNTNFDVTSRSCVFLRGREIVPCSNIKCNSVFLQIFIKWREAECVCVVWAGALEYASLPKIKSVTCCDVCYLKNIKKENIKYTSEISCGINGHREWLPVTLQKKSRLYNW